MAKIYVCYDKDDHPIAEGSSMTDLDYKLGLSPGSVSKGLRRGSKRYAVLDDEVQKEASMYLSGKQKLRYLRRHWPEAAAIGLRFVQEQGHDIRIVCNNEALIEETRKKREYYHAKRREALNGTRPDSAAETELPSAALA